MTEPKSDCYIISTFKDIRLLEQLVRQNQPLVIIDSHEEYIINASMLPEHILDTYFLPAAENQNKNPARLNLNKKEQYKKPYLPEDLLRKH